MDTTFSDNLKSEARYLDIASNGNGMEKVLMTTEAISRMGRTGLQLMEIGPGGGASINALSNYLDEQSNNDKIIARLSIVEMEKVESQSLKDAQTRFETYGETTLHSANAVNLSEIFEPQSVDIISASAVLHEVYSYSGKYHGLNKCLRSISSTLKPGGYFSYRDVYSVETQCLHDEAIQSYHSQSWLRFIKLFVPHYLNDGVHPYHRDSDELMISQDSQLVDASDINPESNALLSGPIGVMREIQRHYITLRDYIWRSGTLGFKPELEGPGASDWLDVKNGHKRVHYTLNESKLLTDSQRSLLISMSEPNDGKYVIDGDIFDSVTDTAMNAFLAEVVRGNKESTRLWGDWLEREGKETYAYMTLDQLIGSVAIRSLETNEHSTNIMLPERASDVARMPRTYYNRFLEHRLSNPLFDGKQLVLFKKIPLADVSAIQSSLEVVQKHCSRATMASLYSLINTKV